MTQTKPKYANFPERDFKVVIGPNINATTTKTLSRLSIGTYEMSFMQQERAKLTNDAVKSALSPMIRQQGYTATREESREFVCQVTVANAEHSYTLWVTTPFELTQSGHLIWCKYCELAGDKKVGISFKLATGFNVDDITNIIKAAQKNAVVIPEGESYTLKGNPPPRFQKKEKAAETPAADAPAAEAPAPAAGEQPAS